MKEEIKDIRIDYQQGKLMELDLATDPIESFRWWLTESISKKCKEPTAMTLSTVSADGKPSGRIVLLKELTDEDELVFFTNYESRKGVELQFNPYAGISFFWADLERQVRMVGKVERLDSIENETYFNSRPLASRLAACISPQSRVIPSRAWLDERFARIKQENEPVVCPNYWGGYKFSPEEVEFWQGGEYRLHDRIHYVKQGEIWIKERLAP